MALDVNALKRQIAKEKESLKSVDENIRKITGRDPNEPRERPVDTRRISLGGSVRGRDDGISFRRTRSTGSQDAENESGPPRKRAAVFSRLGPSVGGERRRVAVSRTMREEKDDEDYDEDVGVKPAVQSSVVSTAKKITKDELINAQNVGEKGRARNRRMFGMLLGTLAKFNEDGQGRQSKQTLKQKEVETRLEEETEQERRKLASERKILFTERRTQQKRINLMEEKIALANELVEWEHEWEKKSRYIMTKATPSIFFLPNDFNPTMQRALQDSKERIKGLVEKHKTSVAKTMNAYDDEIKILENKQDNGNGVKNGEGTDANRGFKRGRKVDNEPEEEMDLDSMEHHVDIKVDVEDADRNPQQPNAEREDQSNQSQSNAKSLDTEMVESVQLATLQENNDNAENTSSPKPAIDHSIDEGTDRPMELDDINVQADVANTAQSHDVTEPRKESTLTANSVVDVIDNSDTAAQSADKENERTNKSDSEKQENQGDSSSGDSASDNDDGESNKHEVKSEGAKGSPSKDENIPDRTSNEAPTEQSEVKTTDNQDQSAIEQHTETAKITSTKTEVTRKVSRDREVAPRQDSSKKNSKRHRRDSSSSSDSTSSSSSSSDETSRKTSRRRSSDTRSRDRRDRDSYRSRRYRRDRSRSRSRDRGGRRDRRKR